MQQTISPVLATAFEALDLGLSPVIVHAVGEPWMGVDESGRWAQKIDKKTGQLATYPAKVPCGAWKEQQTTPLTREKLQWYAESRLWGEWGPKRGVALVCGFGGCELLEFDDIPSWERFYAAAVTVPNVWQILRRVMNGYHELSPRGAPHLLYRCSDLSNGGPLARRPVIVSGDDGAAKLQVLIETRSRDQIAVIAPTPGTCHKTGRPYALVRGGLSSMTTLAPCERKTLLDFARTFDEVGPDEPPPPPSSKPLSSVPRKAEAGEMPGVHFNKVCTPEMWQGMLAEWKWEYVGSVSGRQHCWVHAAATSSLSAHLTPKNTLLIYSTSTPLKCWTESSPTTHSPFYVFAAIFHKNDLRSAARALGKHGYGSQAKVLVRS